MIDVAIIGAGPAGTVAASLLVQQGWKVELFERDHFPRFSIGESLLPQAMEWLEQAGLLRDVVEAGFQHKNGAVFRCGEQEEAFDFREKSAPGWGTTYQVRRDCFDQILAEGAMRKGAVIHFGHTVTRMVPDAHAPRLTIRDEAGAEREITARFVLDASGFGRTLARLLELETPVPTPPRMAMFTHIKDSIAPDAFDRNKILISINPDHPQIWYWLIPLADGISSIGVVGEPQQMEPYGPDRSSRFAALIAASGLMGELVKDAPQLRDIGEIKGYACKVSSLAGPGYALLGNAGEFLDPVFSSGLTIALKSANLAAGILDRQLRGADVDWQTQFCQPLLVGIDAFRSYVDAWYGGMLPRIIFNQPAETGKVKTMITSILAGYAWDESNPFASQPGTYLRMVDTVCG
jgi:hypothetical protein